MKRNTWITTVLSLVFVTTSISQSLAQIDTSVEKIEFFNMANSSMVGKRPPLPDVNGTPYLNEEWVGGEVLTKDGQLVQDLELLLNTYDNEVEIKKGGRHLRLPSYTIETIRTYKGQEFIAVENKFPMLYLEGFMEKVKVFENGTLYVRRWCYKKDPTYVEGVGVGSRDYELIHKEEMYLANGDRVARIYNNHKKNVKALKYLGIDYDKRSVLKLKTVEDVQKYLSPT